MPCRPLPGGAGWVCTRERWTCSSCGKTSAVAVLCDHPLTGAAAGRTCDRVLCRGCAVRVGPNRDLCPAHAQATKEK